MHVCNHASDKSPITKARLAYDLARIVNQFIQVRSDSLLSLAPTISQSVRRT